MFLNIDQLNSTHKHDIMSLPIFKDLVPNNKHKMLRIANRRQINMPKIMGTLVTLMSALYLIHVIQATPIGNSPQLATGSLINKQVIISNNPSTSNSQQSHQWNRPNQPVQIAKIVQHPLSVCHLPPSRSLSSTDMCRLSRDQEFKKTAMANLQQALQTTSNETSSLLDSYFQEFRAYFLDLVYVSKNKSLSVFQQQDTVIFDKVTQDKGAELTRHLFESIRNYFDLSGYPTIAHPFLSVHHHHHFHHHSANHNNSYKQTSNLLHNDINTEINHYFRQMQLITIQHQLALHHQRNQHGNNQQQLDPMATCINESLSSNNLDWLLNDQEEHLGIDSLNERLPVAIKQSLDSAHTLLSALALGYEIFHNLTNQASSWMPLDSCHSALARMFICPSCYQQPMQQQNQYQQQNRYHMSNGGGAYQAPPCQNFCLNVLRGCMNDVYELNKFWTDHVTGIQRLKMNMIQTNNIENVFSTLDEKILQMIKMNSSPEVGKRILERARVKCGDTRNRRATISSTQQTNSVSLRSLLRPSAGSVSAAATINTTAGVSRPNAATMELVQLAPQPLGQLAALAQTSPLLSLFNRLDGFVHELQQTRGFFATWPDRICEYKASPSVDATIDSQQQQQNNATSCWNGRDFAPYRAAVVQFGQIGSGNPEVQRPNEPFNPLILNIIDKLKDASSQLSRKNTRSPAASIYNEANLGKYGHLGRNTLVDDNRHSSSLSTDNDDQDSIDDQQAIAFNQPSTNDEVSSAASGKNQPEVTTNVQIIDSQEPGEEEADDFDAEGSGDYDTDNEDYSDNEPDELCDEGEDCQHSQQPTLSVEDDIMPDNTVNQDQQMQPIDTQNPDLTWVINSPIDQTSREFENPEKNNLAGSSATSNCLASFTVVLTTSMLTTCLSLIFSSMNLHKRTLVFI